MLDLTIGKMIFENNAGGERLLIRRQGQADLQHGLFRYDRTPILSFATRLTVHLQRNNSR